MMDYSSADFPVVVLEQRSSASGKCLSPFLEIYDRKGAVTPEMRGRPALVLSVGSGKNNTHD